MVLRGDFLFDIFEFDKVKGGYSIIDYYGNDNDVLVIPDMHNGLPIVEIDTYTFYYQVITDVVLPKFLTHISDSAFYCCDILRRVVLPETLVTINHNAFSKCSKLTEILVPESVEFIGADAFSGCSSLRKIVVLNPDISIHFSSFSGCRSIQEASFFLWEYFDDKVLFNLVCYKFNNWESLEKEEQYFIVEFVKAHRECLDSIFCGDCVVGISLLISEGVELSLQDISGYLGNSIKLMRTQITAILLEYRNNNFTDDEIRDFEKNLELVEMGIELPTLVQLSQKWHISVDEREVCITGYRGFSGSEIVPERTADGYLIKGIKKTYVTDFGDIERLVIDAPIKVIENETFKYSSLVYVKLPESLEKIGYEAFKNCEKLEVVEMGERVKIENNSFENSDVRFVYF